MGVEAVKKEIQEKWRGTEEQRAKKKEAERLELAKEREAKKKKLSILRVAVEIKEGKTSSIDTLFKLLDNTTLELVLEMPNILKLAGADGWSVAHELLGCRFTNFTFQDRELIALGFVQKAQKSQEYGEILKLKEHDNDFYVAHYAAMYPLAISKLLEFAKREGFFRALLDTKNKHGETVFNMLIESLKHLSEPYEDILLEEEERHLKDRLRGSG